MSNMFVAYDLYKLGQNYSGVEQAVMNQGTACKLLNTTWYLKTNKTLEQVHNAIRQAMDANDKLLVIDANNCYGSNLPNPCWGQALKQWHN
jgi:hypothetical protein